MEYNHKKIEKKWQKQWQETGLYEPNLDEAENPYYNLMMFPYPSAEGLHVGNMYAFTGSDIYGRFKRMQGNDVFEPIGLDGFGIHSENYAIKVDTHPVDQAEKSEKNFYRQLQKTGNGFAWNERLETYDPDYYKWTQWLFTEMFENGLAYRKESPVNWCPSCKTVLADEQVISGLCERCDSEVIQKNLKQWFFRITDYADELLDDIENIDWSEKVKTAQKNWIGRSEGSLINFTVKNENSDESISELEVFTTRPDTLFGATYMVVAPEHDLLENNELNIENQEEVNEYIEQANKKTEQERKRDSSKTGIEIKGVKAVNPVNDEEIPVFVADYVLSSYGTGAIMAVPAHDERDYDFAKKHDIEIRKVIEAPEDHDEDLYDGEGKLINSDKLNGVDSEEARNKITEMVSGETKTNYRLRDWLISRQRYWGAPIPIVYCKECWDKNGDEKSMEKGVDYDVIDGEKYMIHSVPKENLPVELPYVEDFRPTGTSEAPLASQESFYKTKCPKCGSEAQRETDVSDTFLDSSWYYLRYVDVDNKEEAFSEKRIKKWLPVDTYIGGAEHAVLHLLYTRFVTKALNDWGHIDFNEPFKKFRAHGLLIKEGSKMSKSKGNVINPDDYIDRFGADVLRTYLMFLAPFEEGGDFRDEGILGITRLLDRVWRFYSDYEFKDEDSEDVEKALHKSIKKISEDIENLKYNTAISQLMVLLNAMEDGDVSKSTSEAFIKMLAPFAPHLTEEIWKEKLGNKESVHVQQWPEYDPELTKEDTFELVIQVNGKVRDTVKTEKGITKEKAIEIAKGSESASKFLKDKEIKKSIFVEDKLINFVV